MTTNKFILYLLLFLAVATRASAQEREQAMELKFTLEEAQAYALEHAPDMIISKLEIKKAEKKVGETRATGLPQINANVEYQNFLDLATQLIPAKFFDPKAPDGEFAEVQFGTPFNMSASVKATQLIFSGSYIVALQATKAYKNLSLIENKLAETKIKDAVRQAYTAVLVSESSLLVLDSMLVATQKNVDDLKAMLKVGFVDETDLDQMELLLSELKNNIESGKAQVDISRNVLKFNMGIELSKDVELVDVIETIIAGIPVQEYLAAEFAVENSISYASAKNMLRIAELQTKLEKSAYLPTLSAYLSYTKNANRQEFNFTSSEEKWFPTTVFGVQLTIPIFSGFERHYKVQKAKVDQQIALTTFDKTNEGLRMEFTTARSTYNTSLMVYENSVKNADLAHKIYDRTQIKYKKGMATSMDLLQVHNQYLEKQQKKFGALQIYLTSKSDLERILTKFENN